MNYIQLQKGDWVYHDVHSFIKVAKVLPLAIQYISHSRTGSTINTIAKADLVGLTVRRGMYRAVYRPKHSPKI